MDLNLIEERLQQFQDHYLNYFIIKTVDKYIGSDNIYRAKSPFVTFNQWLYSKNIIHLVDFEDKNIIPLITDPLGWHWGQPNPRRIICDNTTAQISQDNFDKLMNYSTSQPTGVYIGKMWKGQYELGGWYLAWYGPHPTPGYCSNNYRDIKILDEV
jgi:hypothetical protein